MTEIDLRRPQLVADGHIPTIAPQHDGRWGVHCEACSRVANAYVWPCREGVDYDVPAVLVAATELEQAGADLARAIELREDYREMYKERRDLGDALRDDLERTQAALETARVYGGDVARQLAGVRAELEQAQAQRDALLSWAAGNLGNSLIHKRIREHFGLPVDPVTMMSPEVHALASPAAAPQVGEGTHQTSTPAELSMWDDAALALLLRAKSLIAKATHYMNGSPDNSPWHKDASRWMEHHAAFTGEDEPAATPVVSVPTTAADTSGPTKRRCAYEPGCDGTPLPADLACDRHPACAECGGLIMHDIGCQTARAERLAALAAERASAAASGTGTDGGEQP